MPQLLHFVLHCLRCFGPTRIDRRTARTSAGRVVEENALQAHISALRAGLGSERELNSAAFAGSLRERRWLASDPWRLRARPPGVSRGQRASSLAGGKAARCREIRTAQGRRERGDGAPAFSFDRSHKTPSSELIQPEPIKHLSSKFARRLRNFFKIDDRFF